MKCTTLCVFLLSLCFASEPEQDLNSSVLLKELTKDESREYKIDSTTLNYDMNALKASLDGLKKTVESERNRPKVEFAPRALIQDLIKIIEMTNTTITEANVLSQIPELGLTAEDLISEFAEIPADFEELSPEAQASEIRKYQKILDTLNTTSPDDPSYKERSRRALLHIKILGINMLHCLRDAASALGMRAERADKIQEKAKPIINLVLGSKGVLEQAGAALDEIRGKFLAVEAHEDL